MPLNICFGSATNCTSSPVWAQASYYGQDDRSTTYPENRLLCTPFLENTKLGLSSYGAFSESRARADPSAAQDFGCSPPEVLGLHPMQRLPLDTIFLGP